MADGATCATCAYVRPTGCFDEGQCRRHAPLHRELRPGEPGPALQWPVVSLMYTWCGDYTPSRFGKRTNNG